MPVNRFKASRILYMAGSVGEFPNDVQEWLSRPENPAIASSNPYEATALLARGLRPAVILVSMPAIDWSEMEFFSHAENLCRDALLFVHGPPHQQAKVDSACKRGARPLDLDLLEEAVLVDLNATGDVSTAGIMAGASRSTSGSRDVANPPTNAPGSTHSSAGTHANTESMRLVPLADPSTEVHDDVLKSDQGSGPAEMPSQQPTPGSPDAIHDPYPQSTTQRAPASGAGRSGDEISVPWSPSPRRPQRTPPSAQTRPPESSPAQSSPGHDRHPFESGGPSSSADHSMESETVPLGNVHLSPEEVAALLGHDPPAPGSSEEEKRP